MRLSELMEAVGTRALTFHEADGRDAEVTDVVLDDGVTPLGPRQVVLAVRSGQEAQLFQRCADAGCLVMVVGVGTSVPTGAEGPIVLQSAQGWTALFVLLRTMVLTSHDESAQDDIHRAVSSVHGIADAIAVMVGGTVVLYDRAHRVIAYSVQEHAVDDVRRDAILGRRTPDQWIRRFTVDRTAYQTFDVPGKVVRVAGYEGLRTRLRIALHAEGEVVGEISVAEGNHPLPADAEETLERAARLAAPAMLRHRRATDVQETARERAVRAMLCDGAVAGDSPACVAPFSRADDINVLAVRIVDPEVPGVVAHEILTERLGHFLSLHARTLSRDAQVVHIDGTFYVVLPGLRGERKELERLANVVLRQMEGMKVAANAALGKPVSSPSELSGSKQRADELLRIAQRSGARQRTMSMEQQWAEVVLLAATDGVAASSARSPGLEALRRSDSEQGLGLVETLRAYLDNFGSVSAAAAQLFVHSNTLRHRLTRISEISGLDLDDATQRLAVALLLETPASAETPRTPGPRAGG